MTDTALETIDCTVIGAGVVGLAIARALALQGREVVVLESEDGIGTGTSSRNSEVIHAGIYYPKDSLKAQFCVEGKKMLYAFCQSHGVDTIPYGKLIVATTEEQVGKLDEIKAKAEANGVMDLEWLGAGQTQAMEPALKTAGALLSPSTGVVDSHSLMLALQGDAEENGAMIAFNSPVAGGEVTDDGIIIRTGGADPMAIKSQIVINAAGLGAQGTSHSINGIPESSIPPLYYAKGNYFTLTGKSPFKHLIYPVPEQAGLGIHLTLDLGGQARFGPDVEWVDDLYYPVDPARGEKFYEAIRTYWPGLEDGKLQPGYSGIRPKLQKPGEEARDFVIQDETDHGIKGLVCLYGIESPGLTSSLAIAKNVATRFT